MSVMRLSLFLPVVAAVTAFSAEPASVVPLWPGNPPGETKANGPEQDTSKPGEGLVAGKPLIRLANVTKPELQVFLPPKDKATGTAVVVCPGGGFHILAMDLEGTEVAEWLNSIGVAAIVLKYRVPTASLEPRWLTPTIDGQRAISVVRSRAAEWGINPERIGILGFSAGGHLAASGVSVPKEAPPFFFVHAFDDKISPLNSLLLAAEAKKSGVSAEVHVYDAGGHGYGLRPQANLPVTSWPKRCEEWMQRNGWLAPAN
jgi:acetyl esterase/lipase